MMQYYINLSRLKNPKLEFICHAVKRKLARAHPGSNEGLGRTMYVFETKLRLGPGILGAPCHGCPLLREFRLFRRAEPLLISTNARSSKDSQGMPSPGIPVCTNLSCQRFAPVENWQCCAASHCPPPQKIILMRCFLKSPVSDIRYFGQARAPS